MRMHESPLKENCRNLGIAAFSPESLAKEEFLAEIRNIEPDLGIVVSFGRIIPGILLRLFTSGMINVHFSLLPNLRGAAPIERAILSGLEETGVTVFRMDEGLDTGPVITSEKLRIGRFETRDELRDRLVLLSLPLLEKTLDAFEKKSISAVPQDGLPVYAPKIKKEDTLLDWKEDAESVFRRIKAFSHSPGSHTFLPGGKRLKIVSGRPSDFDSPEKKRPGTLVYSREDGFLVACGRGYLLVKKVQLEGKKQMDSSEFLRGRPELAGCILGAGS